MKRMLSVPFWLEEDVVRRLMPFVACLIAAPMALLLSDGTWEILVLPFLIVGAVVICYSPLYAILIWILIFPYFVRQPLFAGAIFYWGLHRLMIMGALTIAILQLLSQARPKPRWYPGELIMLMFLGFMAAGILIRGNDPVELLRHFFDRLVVPFAIYFLIRILAPAERDLRKFLPVAVVTIVIQAGIGLISWFVPSLLPTVWTGEEGERVVGSFANAATYTSTLIFLAVFLLNYAMSRNKRSLLETGYLLMVGLAFLCVFLSFSRGSWLGGLLVLLGLCVLYPRLVIPSTLVMTLVGAILGGIVFSRELDWASERLHHDASAENRIVGAMASLQMAVEKPWFGWGYGTYDQHAIDFKVPVGNIPVRSESTSHNTYLTILAEDGILALILYLAPVAWLFVRSLKVWKSLPTEGFLNRRWLALLWLCVLDHFAVSSFMDMIRFNLFGTNIFWMALGLIACLVYPTRKPGVKESAADCKEWSSDCFECANSEAGSA